MSDNLIVPPAPHAPPEPDGARAPATPPASDTVPPTLVELFVSFLRVSLFGFGGVLAWSRRMLVQDKRWMTPESYNELLALCQILPGPNIINLTAVFGARVRGVSGALAGLAGLLGPTFILMVAAGFFYRAYGAQPELQGVLKGLSAAAAGLFISTAAQIADPLLRRRPGVPHVIAVTVFVAIGILRFPMPLVLLVLVPLSIALAWTNRT